MMRNGWQLGRVAGIDITVHWSFSFLIAYVVFATLMGGGSMAHALIEVGFVAVAFGCVVLHELGHAMAARGFGVRTHGITLLPIGGVANLESIPRNPFQELVIALAGPMVNVLIAAAILPISLLYASVTSDTMVNFLGGHFLHRVLALNVVMILFNLLPVFPMDGGRVLRAALAFRLPYLKATEWAVSTSRVMSVLFLIAGFFYSPFLIFIAIFMYSAGSAELQRLREEIVPPNHWPESWRVPPVFRESPRVL